MTILSNNNRCSVELVVVSTITITLSLIWLIGVPDPRSYRQDIAIREKSITYFQTHKDDFISAISHPDESRRMFNLNKIALIDRNPEKQCILFIFANSFGDPFRCIGCTVDPTTVAQPLINRNVYDFHWIDDRWFYIVYD